MSRSSAAPVTLPILGVMAFTFIGYLCTGIPLAVLPAYVHQALGFSSAVAGLAIGLQYFATLLARPAAGRLADSRGTKRGVLYGLLGIALSGALTLLATLLQAQPGVTLALLLGGRVVLGAALSIIGVSAISWGIARVGSAHSARVIAWNGIAAYAAIGIGAPLGVSLAGLFGPWVIGAALSLLAGVALLLLLPKAPAPVISGERLPFASVLWRVSPYGMGLALGSIGYGSLTTFITLYYASRGWDSGAAYCLSAFGVAFIAARLLLLGSLKRFGGFRVAVVCLAVEVVGLLVLWLTPSPGLALLGAALTGVGLSLVYPALGMEVLDSIPDNSRSAGLSAYSIFFDLALGAAGPLMGLLASGYGYAAIFPASALLAFAGLLLTLELARRARGASSAAKSLQQ